MQCGGIRTAAQWTQGGGAAVEATQVRVTAAASTLGGAGVLGGAPSRNPSRQQAAAVRWGGTGVPTAICFYPNTTFLFPNSQPPDATAVPCPLASTAADAFA